MRGAVRFETVSLEGGGSVSGADIRITRAPGQTGKAIGMHKDWTTRCRILLLYLRASL